MKLIPSSVLLLFLLSCNSPEARLERLQHDFWEKFAKRDFFEIRLKSEVLHLPLPPSAEQAKAQPALANSLQKEANAIEADKLSMEGKKQLAQLRAALADCVAQSGSPFFDPSRCAVSAHLAQLLNHPELPLFLEKIPEYYAQIEHRGQAPDARFVSKAVAESQTALDLLQDFDLKSKGKMEPEIAAARNAVKDFIGLCQSALLGAGVK